MGWLSSIGSIFQTIGIALGWIKREEEKKDDFQIANAANLGAVVKEQQSAQVIDESVDALSDAELVKRLRKSQSGS